MNRKSIKAALMSAVIGLGVWGILQVETEEATATVTRTFALHERLDNGNCPSAAGITSFVFTYDNGAGSWTNNGYVAAGKDHCGAEEGIAGATFNQFAMVDINQGATENLMGTGSGVGWTPSSGSHSGDVTSLLGECIAKDCSGNSSYCGGVSTGKYMEATGTGLPTCIYQGEFNN